MIPKKFSNILFFFLMALILPAVITFVNTLLNVGFSDIFLFKWLKSYIVAFIVAFPTILLIAPVLRKLVDKITK